MSPTSIPPIPPPSARRYEALVKIASGGTAAVWVGALRGATDAPLVAIKLPHAHLADDPSFRRALVAEATIASRVRHENVVDVRDVEEDDEGIALVMRYVEGASLSELIRSWSREPPARAAACAIRVALDTCAGLSVLHDLRDDAGRLLGVVHRDVSPANVLVGLDGTASITDFGLAKPLYAVERTTSEGALRGKLGYMAPEYVRGKDIDRRIDVFAMGVVVWEALAKKRLFRGENDAATLERVQRLDPPALASVAPELGSAAAALDVVLARALAKDPEARTPTVDALARELEDVASRHGLVATHAEVAASFGPQLRAELETRRERVKAALAARALGRASPTARAARAGVASDATVEPTVRTRMEDVASRPKRVAVLAAAGVLAVVLAGGALTLARPRAPEATANANASAEAKREAEEKAKAEPSADESVDLDAGRAAVAPPEPKPASKSPAVRPRSVVSAASAAPDAPGHKKPRPNPYLSP